MPKARTPLDAQIAAAEAEWAELYAEGPTRVRWDRVPLQVGDDAPDATVLDTDGNERRLSEFWSENPTIVSFWRHFGCNCGIERASRLREELPKYADAGLDFVVVTQGDPERAADYAARRGIGCPVVCDPERSVYDAYDLIDFSLPQVFQGVPDEYLNLDVDAGAKLAAERRANDQHMVDNPWQQSGEFLVDTDGVVRHVHRAQYCEDHPDPEVFVTAGRMR